FFCPTFFCSGLFIFLSYIFLSGEALQDCSTFHEVNTYSRSSSRQSQRSRILSSPATQKLDAGTSRLSESTWMCVALNFPAGISTSSSPINLTRQVSTFPSGPSAPSRRVEVL